MMAFQIGNRRRQPTKRQRIIGIGTAVAAATVGIVSNVVNGGQRRHGSIGSMTTLLIFGGIIALPIIGFLVLKLISRENDDEPREDSVSGGNTMNDSSGETTDEDDGRPRRALLVAIAAALAAIGIGLFAYASTAHAQGAADRGALFIRNGTDTLVTDRFARTGDTLRGRVRVKGGQNIAYSTVLGPANEVRTIAYDVYAATAKDGDAPTMHLLFTMKGDTAIAETPAGIQRVATKTGAIPMFANMLALTELFTRRARAAGGTAQIPFLAMNGTTLMAIVAPAGRDSLVVNIAGQETRFRVDAIGRILGGVVPGKNFEFVRGSAVTAEELANTPGTGAAAARDYSAPPGAPYTAEEVKVRTAAGFNLGGTLTRPKNANGRLPAVVTITGSGQQDRDEFIPFAGGIRLFRELADTLSRRGIAVLRLDDRGLGASGGDASTATTADFADDIRAAVAFLRSRPDIDPNRIALAGHSEGGIIAPMIAATDPEIHAIVILAGTSEKGIEISMGQNKYIVDHNPSLTQAQRDSILASARIALGKQTQPWLKFFLGYDPAVALTKVRIPTLYIQGETDRQVPAAQAAMGAALIRSNGNKDVTVRLFPATNHLFVPDSTGDITKYDSLKVNRIRPEVVGAIADWLALKLGASPAVK